MINSVTSANVVAAMLCLGFIVLQISHINYGTWINNIPHIADTPVQGDDTFKNLQRDAIVSQGNELSENQNTWLIRYKLYAVTADEMVNLMAMSRIRPAQFEFDPHFYMYGGAYLYPLGLWYAAGYGIGLLPLPTLPVLLSNPDAADMLYVWGRLFVLLTFTASAWIFYKAFLFVYSDMTSVSLLAVYLGVPGSLTFSIAMKPHWYALFWAAITMYVLIKIFSSRSASYLRILLLAISIGLAVGSSTTYALFAVAIYGALIIAWRKNYISLGLLATIPIVAVVIFLIANPYVFLNYGAYQQERTALLNWYTTRSNPSDIAAFIRNSLAAGFGIAGLFAIGVSIWELVHRRSILRMGLASALIGMILIAGVVTSATSSANTMYRFVPFFLPLALLLIGRACPPKYVVGLAILTVLLSIPTALSYRDEARREYSTRMRAVAWVESHLPAGTSFCMQMVPYNSIPLDFTKYTITPNCQYAVEVHPYTTTKPAGGVVAQFRPRLYSTNFPLVYSEIQPRIYITAP